MHFVPTCVPENLAEAAKHLAATLVDPASFQTRGHFHFQDSEGNKFKRTKNFELATQLRKAVQFSTVEQQPAETD